MVLPDTRKEHFYNAILGNESCPDYPERTRSREENYLNGICVMTAEMKEKIDALESGMNYKGSVADYDHLPTDATKGDVYTTLDDGSMYVWDGTTWVELGSKGAAPVTSVNGKTGAVVLTASDIRVLNTQSVQANLERIDEELGRLEDEKQGLLTAGANISIVGNVISATGGGAPTAADLDEVMDGSGDITVDLNAGNDTLIIGTHAKTVTIADVPPTAEQGTLTEQQLAALEESVNSIIVFNNEIYRLNDNGHEAGTRGYSHIGVENSVFMIKNITVTLNTRGWVLTTKELN